MKHHKTYAKDYLGWWTYYVFHFLVNMIPMRVSYFFAGIIGDILLIFDKKHRDMIRFNIMNGPGLSGKELDRAVRNIFKGFFVNIVDFLCFEKFNEKWFKNKTSFENIDTLSNAYKEGKGIILLSSHLGNVEVGALMLHMKGFVTNGIYLSHKNKRVEEYFLSQREKKGLKIIHTGGALKRACEALSRGELVAFVADHAYNGKGVEVDFFGSKAVIPSGAAIAAKKTGAPIIPAVAVRVEGNGFRVVCGDRIDLRVTGDNEQDIKGTMQATTLALEKLIKRYPGQWVLYRHFVNK